jgi:hypothetical protein
MMSLRRCETDNPAAEMAAVDAQCGGSSETIRNGSPAVCQSSDETQNGSEGILVGLMTKDML